MNWAQLKAIIWLRWRLSRNQFLRGGQLNAVLSVVLIVFMLLAGAGLAVGGFALGFFVAAKSSPPVLLLIWDAVIVVFVAFWFSGLMVEIQRSEVVDLTKLLHLPVTLPQVFAFNYVASHFTPAIVALLPAMLGISAGLALGAGPVMALMAPLVVGFVLAVTAWTYCLRGWLAALMTNKRRRRTIVVWIALAFVLVAQTPNLLFNSGLFRRRQATLETGKPGGDPTLPQPLVQAHAIIPLGWPGYGAMQLAQGRPASALALTAAALMVAALGLTRAYHMTMRFYRGSQRPSNVPAPVASGSAAAKPRENGVRGRLLVERGLPWLSDDTTGLALATFRSLTRAPELKMALVMPLVLCVIVAGIRFNGAGRASLGPSAARSTFVSFALTGVIVTAAFALTPTMSNMFGLDRNGFRALVLLPVRRDKIMFAKNLAFFPFTAAVTLLVMLLVTWAFHVPWQVFLVGLLQMPTAFLLFSPICNFFSILVPYRLSEGTLKAQKPKAMVFLAAFGTLLITPIVLVPIVIPPVLKLIFSTMHWLPWLPVDLLAAIVVFAAAAGLYRSLLPPQGRLLQRREQTILREVTAEVE